MIGYILDMVLSLILIRLVCPTGACVERPSKVGGVHTGEFCDNDQQVMIARLPVVHRYLAVQG
jgi:hypothetical protein